MAAKFGVPVCPHAGGIGLCEYVQHISTIDYIAVSGDLTDRTTEFADHLHEHFLHPVRVADGRYRIPEDAGYSAEMHPGSIERLTYPTGTEWSA
jgi:L-fuconate dehydratase